MPRIKNAQARIEYLNWKYTPASQREHRTKAQIAKHLGVSVHALNDWDRQEGEMEAERLVNQIRQMDEAVFQAGAINKTAKMAELWYKRRGLLVEKQEIKQLVLTADDYDRLRREAKEELGRELQGIREVQAEPDLLPGEIRQD